jgi:DNA-binding MarR family transcriptional regulator
LSKYLLIYLPKGEALKRDENGEKLNERLDNLNGRLIAQRKDVATDNFLTFIYTCDLTLNYLDSELRKSGVNRTQIGILTSLALAGGTKTPTQLSGDVLRSKFAVIKAIDSLERIKMIKSEKSDLGAKGKPDRRLRNVRITEKGLELLENHMPERRRLNSKAMGGMSKRELTCLKSILDKIRINILAPETSNKASKA